MDFLKKLDALLKKTPELLVNIKRSRRMDIMITRAVRRAILNGEMNQVEHEDDRLFHIQVPRSCPGVPAAVRSQCPGK